MLRIDSASHADVHHPTTTYLSLSCWFHARYLKNEFSKSYEIIYREKTRVHKNYDVVLLACHNHSVFL